MNLAPIYIVALLLIFLCVVVGLFFDYFRKLFKTNPINFIAIRLLQNNTYWFNDIIAKTIKRSRYDPWEKVGTKTGVVGVQLVNVKYNININSMNGLSNLEMKHEAFENSKVKIRYNGTFTGSGSLRFELKQGTYITIDIDGIIGATLLLSMQDTMAGLITCKHVVMTADFDFSGKIDIFGMKAIITKFVVSNLKINIGVIGSDVKLSKYRRLNFAVSTVVDTVMENVKREKIARVEYSLQKKINDALQARMPISLPRKRR